MTYERHLDGPAIATVDSAARVSQIRAAPPGSLYVAPTDERVRVRKLADKLAVPGERGIIVVEPAIFSRTSHCYRFDEEDLPIVVFDPGARLTLEESARFRELCAARCAATP